MTGASKHLSWQCPPGTLMDYSDAVFGEGGHDG